MPPSENNAPRPPRRKKAPSKELELFASREPRNDSASSLVHCWPQFQEAARSLVMALDGPDKDRVIAGIVAGDTKAILTDVEASIKALERIKRECQKVQLHRGAVVKMERLE